MGRPPRGGVLSEGPQPAEQTCCPVLSSSHSFVMMMMITTVYFLAVSWFSSSKPPLGGRSLGGGISQRGCLRPCLCWRPGGAGRWSWTEP